jgi:glycosyltransferase involved in cell wall biosynthesis
MEAATHGVPAVAYREAGGVAESIVHEQTGMLVDGGLEDFAQALDAVLSDPVHRDRLGESARIRSEEFTWAATTASFADVLGGVAAKGGVSVVPAPSGHVEHHGGQTSGVDQLSP